MLTLLAEIAVLGACLVLAPRIIRCLVTQRGRERRGAVTVQQLALDVVVTRLWLWLWPRYNDRGLRHFDGGDHNLSCESYVFTI